MGLSISISESQNFSEPPPPYRNKAVISEPIHLDNLNKLRSLTVDKITSEMPVRWLWDRHDCRLWIYSVLYYRCRRATEFAYATANRFDGFGVTMFSMTVDEWYKLVENETDAKAIHLMLFSQRGNEGVPDGLHFAHWDQYIQKD
jgi:hypothetical protein